MTAWLTCPPTPPGEAPPPAPGRANPFAGQRLYAPAGSPAEATASTWAAEGRTAEAAEIEKIASQPAAQWFGDWSYGHGGTEGDVSWWVGAASAAGALPVLVAYDLPWRDCGSYSAGGASGPAAYRSFVDQMAAGIAGRPAVVILEPDALAELGCLDAGNEGWQPPATIAARLVAAGVASARGFSLNVSNFYAPGSEAAYGEAVSAETGTGAHFVLDTSRDGRALAPGAGWCNPTGAGLGPAPTGATANQLLDAYLWVKRPGESDGACNGGPAAGQWWAQYALALARNASW